MKLKSRLLNWSTGRPVVLLNSAEAKKLNLHLNDRILLRHNGLKIVAVIDIATGLINIGEIGVSTEVSELLHLKNSEEVDFSLANAHEAISIIKKKMQNLPLSRSEIKDLIQAVVQNSLSEAEIAFFVSAVSIFGLSFSETVSLIEAIVASGKKISFSNKAVFDKHSIGGVSGRTTPIVVSICAAAGLTIPKTSSRAITSAAGTADALETICPVALTASEIQSVVKKTNACMVWGGSLHLAPADDILIRVERLLNLDPTAQLLASIISKKLAISAKYVVIDIPYGAGAKVNKKEAESLEKEFSKIGKHFGIKITSILTKGDEPIGNGIGPVLEMLDVFNVLQNKNDSYKLKEKSILLSAKLLELSGKAKKDRSHEMALKILSSGMAYKKFVEIVEAQGGKEDAFSKLKPANNFFIIKAEKNFTIKRIDNKNLNQIAIVAGCPLDKSAGILLHRHLNAEVKKSEPIMTIYAESEQKLKDAVKLCKQLHPVE